MREKKYYGPEWIDLNDNYPFDYCANCNQKGYGIKVKKYPEISKEKIFFDRVCQCGYVFFAWWEEKTCSRVMNTLNKIADLMAEIGGNRYTLIFGTVITICLWIGIVTHWLGYW